MPEREVISNTSPLLYLHQVGQLDLLHHLLELTYTGTLGVLVRAKREGHLSAIRPVVEALQNRTNMRLRGDLVERVLTEAGEV